MSAVENNLEEAAGRIVDYCHELLRRFNEQHPGYASPRDQIETLRRIATQSVPRGWTYDILQTVDGKTSLVMLSYDAEAE